MPQFLPRKLQSLDGDSRDREKFICTRCGHFDHADKQAARNIKAKAVSLGGLILKKVRRDSAKPPRELTQLVLWGTPTPESTGVKRRQPGFLTVSDMTPPLDRLRQGKDQADP